MLTLAASILLGLVGCGGGDLEPPLSATTPRPGSVDQFVRARFRMNLSGAESVKVSTVTSVHIVEILGGRNPEVTWFLSVSVGKAIPLQDGRLVQYTADLSPGLYRGAGTYTMTERAAVSIAGKSGLPSAAYVQLGQPGGTGAFARYDRFVQPCTLTVTEKAVSGRLRCPALGDEHSKTISSEWSWERV